MSIPTITSAQNKREGRSRREAARTPDAQAARLVARWWVSADGLLVCAWSLQQGVERAGSSQPDARSASARGEGPMMGLRLRFSPAIS